LRLFLYAGQTYQGFDWFGETLVNALNVYQLMPDWLIVVLSTLFLWWRGLRLGQRLPSVQAVVFSFYVGVISFIGFVLIVHLVTFEDPSAFIPIFFFCSLVALAAARMHEMRWRRGAAHTSFSLLWLFAITLAAITVVLLGVALGALLAGRDFKTALGWIQPLMLPVGVALGIFGGAPGCGGLAAWILAFARGGRRYRSSG
jgi:hypothetical protein